MQNFDTKEADSTVERCGNGHPLWVAVQRVESTVYYEQEEGVTDHLYRRDNISGDDSIQVEILCDHGCKVPRAAKLDLLKMFDRTPR